MLTGTFGKNIKLLIFKICSQSQVSDFFVFLDCKAVYRLGQRVGACYLWLDIF